VINYSFEIMLKYIYAVSRSMTHHEAAT